MEHMPLVTAQELATLTANQERLQELLAAQDCYRFLFACSGPGSLVVSTDVFVSSNVQQSE